MPSMERTNGAPDEVNGHTNEATNGTNGYSNHHMNGACQQENGSAHEHNGQTNGTPNGANTEFSPKVLNTCSAADRSTLSLFDLTGKPYNIQVNALFPGWIHTGMSERFVHNKVFNDNIVSTVPARRWGKPDDFKGVTAFPASSASDYVSGARIFVDGGIHSM